MGKIKPVVVSYLRFSRPEQARGDSIRRQLALSDAWCKLRGLAVDTSLSDKGISAYRGANAATGALGTFFELVQSARVPRGSILIVESLDRLSRTEILNALTQFLNLINAGITIVTLADNREFSAATLSGPMAISDLTYSLMIMSRAHEESATKSRRLSEAWVGKRAKIAERPLTRQLPGWCRLEGKKIAVAEAKAQAVRKLYQWALEGMGLTTICKRANAELPTMGRVDYWFRSYVHKTLTNRSVLGEFQPHRVQYVGGRKKREPVGEPVPDYFPAILDEETFAAVQATLAKGRRSGGPASGFVSIFRGLLHAPDGSHYHAINKGKGFGDRLLISAAVMDGRKGAGRQIGFPLSVFEAAFFSRLSDMANLTVDDAEADTLRRKLLATEGEIELLETRIKSLKQALMDTSRSSLSVVQVLSELDERKIRLERDREAIHAELRSAEMGSPADAAEQINQLLVDSLLKQLNSDKRMKLRSLVNRMVRRVDCAVTRESTITRCAVRVQLTTGKAYEYAVKVHKYNPGSYTIQWDNGCETLSLNQEDAAAKWYEPAEIVRMRKSGKKLSEIAAETGLCLSAIYRAFHRAGATPQSIKPNVRSLRWAGHTRQARSARRAKK